MCSRSRHRIIVGVLVAVSVCGVAGVVLAVYFASKLTENVCVYCCFKITAFGVHMSLQFQSGCLHYIFICLFFPPSLAGNSTQDSSGKTLAWKEGLIFFLLSSLIIFLFAIFLSIFFVINFIKF